MCYKLFRRSKFARHRLPSVPRISNRGLQAQHKINPVLALYIYKIQFFVNLSQLLQTQIGVKINYVIILWWEFKMPVFFEM